MSTQKRKPAIRFAGFTDDWEQRKLGEVLSLLKDGTHGTHQNVNNGVFLLSAKNIKNGKITIDEEDRKISIAEYEQIHSSFRLKKGDILLTIVGTIGDCAILQNAENITFQRSVAYLRPNLISSDFLYAFITNTYFQNELKNKQVTSAQSGIYLGDLSKIEIFYPKSIEEQTLIGEFFKQLDETIALHQRECEKYQNLKNSYLEKMFPKENEQFPQLRFPQFTDAWEQRKLGEVADIRRGASPRPIQDPIWFDKKSKVGWLRISDVTEQNGKIYNLEQKLSIEGQKHTLVLTQPHLILSIAATVGKPVINYVPTGIHDGFIVFLNLNADMEYLYQWLSYFQENWKNLGQSGSQVNINSDLVRNLNIYLPCRKEQTLIGEFFKQLDETIALHQRALEKAKQIKQFYLEKMFV